MTFQNLKIWPSSTQSIEMLECQLLEAGALSVTLEDAGDHPVFEPLPDEVILWEKTRVSALFPQEIDLNALVLELQQAQADNHCEVEPVIEKDWEKVWIEASSPLCFQNYLWVCSTVCEPPHPHQPVVRLDPGLAFGTGTHPTTALCLDWLAANPPQNKTVIDYGCGSGILGIAALKLGAKKVYAVDHDSQALQATRNNAVLNQLDANQIEVLVPQDVLPMADILLANILANPLIEFADYFANQLKPRGQIVLSGILVSQLPLILSAYQPYFDSLESKEKEGWVVIKGSLCVPLSNAEQKSTR